MKTYKQGKITILTPTFNRGYCLHQLYESLLRQDSFNFEWLIIDDGSTDNTKNLVEEWMKQASFEIKYIRQENEGKMAKLNYAHQIIHTELFTCIDSDDYIVDSAVEDILFKWKEIRSQQNICGMVGLNIFKNGDVVGTEFPANMETIKFREFGKENVIGDKKFVYKTEIVNNYPLYPSFENEKFPAPGYLYRLIDVDYNLHIINEPLCIVEYMDDGLSKNKYSQFRKAPNSWMFYRQERMRLATSYKERFRNAIHYVSSCLFAQKSFFKKNAFPLTTSIAIPFGIALNLYLRKTNKKGI